MALIIIDSGMDMDETFGPMACCAQTATAFR